MHQTRKGKQWHFGMKAHVGVDADSGVVHTLTGTAANVADIAETHRLLHGRGETRPGRCGLYGRGKARRKSWPGSRTCAGRSRPSAARSKRWPKASARKSRSLGEGQGAVARLRRASLPCRQKPLSPSQGALPGSGQEHGATPHAFRPGQPGHRQTCADVETQRKRHPRQRPRRSKSPVKTPAAPADSSAEHRSKPPNTVTIHTAHKTPR